MSLSCSVCRSSIKLDEALCCRHKLAGEEIKNTWSMNVDQSNWGTLQRIFGLKMALPLAAAAICFVRHFENIISRLVLIYVTLDRSAERKYTRVSGDLLPDCGPR